MPLFIFALVLTFVVAPDPAYVKKVQEWRDKHEADYRRDWVTIAGLHFLKPGANSAGGAKTNDIVVSPNVPSTIGRRFVLNGRRVRFEPAAGVKVMLKHQRVASPIGSGKRVRPRAG